MAKAINQRIVDAPLAACWDAWNRFGDIDFFSNAVKKSYLMDGGPQEGMGAIRHCDLADGKNFLEEKIVAYVPNKTISYAVINGSMPLKSDVAKIDLKALGANRTEMTFTMDFEPSMGIVGKLLLPIMKPQFTKTLGRILDGYKAGIEKAALVTT